MNFLLTFIFISSSLTFVFLYIYLGKFCFFIFTTCEWTFNYFRRTIHVSILSPRTVDILVHHPVLLQYTTQLYFHFHLCCLNGPQEKHQHISRSLFPARGWCYDIAYVEQNCPSIRLAHCTWCFHVVFCVNKHIQLFGNNLIQKIYKEQMLNSWYICILLY